MKGSLVSLKAVRIALPKKTITPYEIAPLSSISYLDLPNNGFGIKNYSLNKSKNGHWPVYLKVQNTKITTEIKRIKGDLKQFKRDLTALNPKFEITINEIAGYANVKGDVVNEIKELLDQNIKQD